MLLIIEGWNNRVDVFIPGQPDTLAVAEVADL
jgi:hypothetical protein